MTGCLGSSPLLRIFQIPIAPHQCLDSFKPCLLSDQCPQILQVDILEEGHVPLLNSNSSYQLSWSNLHSICHSWFYGDECLQHSYGCLCSCGVYGPSYQVLLSLDALVAAKSWRLCYIHRHLINNNSDQSYQSMDLLIHITFSNLSKTNLLVTESTALFNCFKDWLFNCQS